MAKTFSVAKIGWSKANISAQGKKGWTRIPAEDVRGIVDSLIAEGYQMNCTRFQDAAPVIAWFGLPLPMPAFFQEYETGLLTYTVTNVEGQFVIGTIDSVRAGLDQYVVAV